MKKRISVLFICIASVLFVCGCGSNVKDPSGYYKLTGVTEYSKEVGKSDLDDYGLDDAYAVFESDESGYFVLMGVPRDFKSDSKKNTLNVKDAGDMSYSVTKDTFTVSDSTITLTFEKSDSKAPKKPDVTFDKDVVKEAGY